MLRASAFHTKYEVYECSLRDTAIPDFCNLKPWSLFSQCLWKELLQKKKKAARVILSALNIRQ